MAYEQNEPSCDALICITRRVQTAIVLIVGLRISQYQDSQSQFQCQPWGMSRQQNWSSEFWDPHCWFDEDSGLETQNCAVHMVDWLGINNIAAFIP